MTDDDIIEMLDWHAATTDHSHNGLLARIRRVVREAEKRQREACATLCDELDNEGNSDDYRQAARWCAERIRMMGTKE